MEPRKLTFVPSVSWGDEGFLFSPSENKKFRVLIATSDYEKFYASLVKKYFDYGYNYSFSITVFMLTLCFSTTITLITPFGSLFFSY